MRYLKVLYVQIILGIIAGGLLGYFSPELALQMKPLGDGFIKLIKMIIAPIIFCTLVTGIVHMGDMKKAATLGLKSLIYFEVLTTLAMVVGLVVGNLTSLGSGMGIDPSHLDAGAIKEITAKGVEEAHHSMADFVMGIIPKSFLHGIVEGNLLQTLFVALLFSWAMLGLGKERAAPVVHVLDTLSHAFFRIVGIIMKLAPFGAFGAIAFTIGKYGVGTLGELLGFVVAFYLICIAFIIVVLGSILKIFTGLNIFKLIRYIKGELLIVLGTASSESVLPRMLEKMERIGVEKQVVGMVLPTGYTFNLDGSSLYFTMAILFLAHATGIDLTLMQQLSILAVLLFTSKGAAAVVGSAFIVLTGTLATVGIIPVEAAILIFGVDRFMAEGRSLTNLIGNCVATLVIGKWEKSVDMQRVRDVLDGKINPVGDTDTTQVVTHA